MAVDNPPRPAAQPANPKLAALKELAPIIGAFAALGILVLAGVTLIVSVTVAPLRDDMRLMHQEMRDGFAAVDDEFKAVRQEMRDGFAAVGVEFKVVDDELKAVDDEFKAVRQDLADLSERLARLETLLEQIIGRGQPLAPPPMQTE